MQTIALVPPLIHYPQKEVLGEGNKDSSNIGRLKRDLRFQDKEMFVFPAF